MSWGINWPPAGTSVYNAGTHALIMPIAKELVDHDCKAVRIDLIFNEAYQYSAGSLFPIWTWIDEAIKQIRLTGVQEIYVVLEPYVPQTTYWKSFNGTNTWPASKRPPQSVVTAFAPFMRDCINHAYWLWCSLGGDPLGFNCKVGNEPGIGGAGCSSETKALLEANGYTGYWDKSSHWSSTWSALLTANALSAHTSNFGFHDAMEIVIPVIMDGVDSRVKFWTPSFECENLTNEFSTHRPAGYTWFNHARFKDANGNWRVSFNHYHGSDGSWILEGSSGAAATLTNDNIAIRSQIISQYGSPCVVRNFETGVLIDYLDDHYQRRVGYAQIGRILRNVIDISMEAGLMPFIYTLADGGATGTTSFALCAGNGTPTQAARVLLDAAGYSNGSTAPNGLTYTTASGEPTTPASS